MTKVDLVVVRSELDEQLVDKFGNSCIKAVCIASIYERNHTVADNSCESIERACDNLREVR